jgi:LAO/AO transport system kinase
MSVPSSPRRPALRLEQYVEGIRTNQRAILGRAITLVESNNPAHQEQSQELLQQILPFTGNSYRIGITGVPGVGKSSFIESLGEHLLEQGNKVAVLAVDPTSSISGGSILGDKTRMTRLSVHPEAFIRPSPSSGSLGGVTRKTRETMLLCEAAGYNIVLVETVGVGQSETLVAGMVDFFLVLMLAGAGDQLQGIKRGILEIADMLAINKADGDNLLSAQRARSEYAAALHYLRPTVPGWTPPVHTCSALERTGLDTLWEEIERYRTLTMPSGDFERKRREQQSTWLWAMVEQQLLDSFHQHSAVKALAPSLEQAVRSGSVTVTRAATQLLEVFRERSSKNQ